jgi:enamine deaminase RidA (YjgF/YER057c/UK114 family)
MSNIARIEKGKRLSRVVIHNGTAYLAGLTAEDRKKDVAGQTAEILAKADELLKQAGSSRSRLLSATIWLRDIADFDRMNPVWERWIDPNEPPARATVEAKLAAPDLLVEIMFMAAVG